MLYPNFTHLGVVSSVLLQPVEKQTCAVSTGCLYFHQFPTKVYEELLQQKAKEKLSHCGQLYIIFRSFADFYNQIII